MTGGAPVGNPRSSAKSSGEVVAQYLSATRMTQFRHGLGLDLADALPSNTVDFADLIQGLGLSVGQAESHRHDTGLSLRQGIEDIMQLLLQQGEVDGVCWHDGLRILNKVTKLRIAILTQWGMQRDRLATVFLHLNDLLCGHIEFVGKLFRGGLTT